MDFLPIFYALRDRECLVVGAGTVARRKVDLLLRAGGRVTVVAPKIEPTLAAQARDGKLMYHEDVFKPQYLQGMALVISATEMKDINRAVAQAAHAINLPINVVDDPELSSFILPAIVDRSPLVVAVSSGGKSPVLARLMKARLESLIPVAYGRLTQLAGDFRDKVKATLNDGDARRKFWERSFQGRAAALFLEGKESEARETMEKNLAETALGGADQGRVTFLLAHPTDPELLSLKALRHLQEADLIVYDPTVPQETLDMARRDAERIQVVQQVDDAPGERCELATEIPALLARQAAQGQHVVRVHTGLGREAIHQTTEFIHLKEQGLDLLIIPAILDLK